MGLLVKKIELGNIVVWSFQQYRVNRRYSEIRFSSSRGNDTAVF